jgi:Zn-dependent protease with chaperone function
MDRKLMAFFVSFFVFLIIFISFVIFSENKNMMELRNDYPDLPEEVFSLRKDNLIVWAINLVLSFLVPLLFLTTRLSQRISIKTGGDRGLFLSGLLYGAVFFIIVFLINLPLNFYSSFYLRHKYGLSDQTFFRWLEVNIKSFLVNDLAMSLFLWIPYYIIYKSPKRWWLSLGLMLIPVLIFMVFITPFVIDPIFNKYTSIEDEALGKQIQVLLDKAGVGDADIYMVDKSRDTKTMNAYMTGISKSKRIVLWDTTIKNMTEDEVLSVTAHEVGHYVKGHIWKNIIIGSLGSLLIAYLVFKTSNWILDLSYGVFGFRNIYNYASIPLLIFTINLFTFFGNPISNYVSRNFEMEADRYEISLTKDRESAVTAMEKLYEQSLDIPRPSKIYKIWYYTHPPLEERVEFYRTTEIE